MPAKYTILEGDRRYKQIDWGGPMPECQAHLMPGGGRLECPNPGDLDSPTTAGPWADLCSDHAILHAPRGTQAGFHRIPRKGPKQ